MSRDNLNIGCPIPLVFNSGAGSARWTIHQLIRMLNIMSYCSAEIPVTAKITMGIKSDAPLPKLDQEIDLRHRCQKKLLLFMVVPENKRYTKLNGWGTSKECAVETQENRGDYKITENDGKLTT